MRYLFYVHKRLRAWRMVTGEPFSMPAGHSIDDWTLTRTRSEEDTGTDVRRDVAEKGYSLFRMGGELSDVARDVRELESRTELESARREKS